MPGQKLTPEIPNARARTSVPTFMYQSIPSLTIPPGNFQLMGEFPHPTGKKGVQTPPPRAYKNEHLEASFSIIHH